MITKSEYGASYTHEDWSWALNVLATDKKSSHNGRPAWRWSIRVGNDVLASGEDLYGRGSAPEMLGALVQTVVHDMQLRRNGKTAGSKGKYVLPESVAKWADGIALASVVNELAALKVSQ